MKSGALLPSNLPSVIDRSNLSPSREVPKQCKGHHGFYIDCHCYRFFLLDKGHEAENLQKECLFLLLDQKQRA